jgi:hypothetical protein
MLSAFDAAGSFGFRKSSLIMTVNAVFDESGKHKDCELVVFGGLMFDPTQATPPFNREWRTLLRASGVPLPVGRCGPFLHMVELNRMHKRANSDRAQQQAIELLAESLAKCICKYAMSGSWNSITVELFRNLPESDRGRYKDPFYYAFESGVSTLANGFCVDSQDDIALICDDSDDSIECLKSFRRLKRTNQTVGDKVSVIAFGDYKVYPPLQAADMFAYCFRAKLSNIESGLWTEPLNIIISTFSDCQPADIHIPNRRGPKPKAK